MLKPKVNVAILGHFTGNIGHLFMAEGIKNIVSEAFKGKEVEVSNFEQHKPFCIYKNYLNILNTIKPGSLNLFKQILNTEKISNLLWRKHSIHLNYFNMAIVAGGPNIVRNVGSSGDMCLMLHHMLGAFYFNHVPVFNLSNGSCFPLENIPEIMYESDSKFWQRSLIYCHKTTVRDAVAKRLFQSIGYDAHLIPCLALASGYSFGKLGERERKYIVINYQRKGANEDWGQNVKEEQWKDIIKGVIINLKKRHKIIMLCHNQVEVNIANELAIAGIEVTYPRTIETYAKVILAAKVGLVSRLHAAIPLAGVGIPSIVIGTDTRLFSAKLLGLQTIYVKDAISDILVDNIENLIINSDKERDRLFALREETKKKYITLLQELQSK